MSRHGSRIGSGEIRTSPQTPNQPPKLNRRKAGQTRRLHGNVTGDGASTYAYDATNRLLSIAGFVTASYGYDALDRRMSKTTGGTTTRFLHAGSDEIAEYTSAGVLLRRYVPGPGTDERAAMIDSGLASPPATAIKYPHTDRQGSVMAVTSTTGAVSERFAYDGFGRSNSALSGYPFRYTGQRLDFESGLMFYKARVYSTALGRFLQTDPIGTKDDLNLYAYVGNDPINGTDPTGACKFSGPSGIPNVGCYLADVLAYPVNFTVARDFEHDSVRNDIYDVITQPVAIAGDVAPAFPVGGAFSATVRTESAIAIEAAAVETNVSRVATRFVPNPYGKLGGPAHQGKVAEIAADIEARGLEAVREFRVPTPTGAKGHRFVDIAARDPATGQVMEMFQVGRQTTSGRPIAREQQALDDIRCAMGNNCSVTFVPLN